MASLNLQRIFLEIYNFLFQGEGISGLVAHIKNFLQALAPFSVLVSLLFLTGIFYCMIRIAQIRAEQRHELESKAASQREEPGASSEASSAEAQKWEKIKGYLGSENVNDWKQAIIEADIMLDALLSERGYEGGDVGEKLKQVDKGKMPVVDKAWQAHKVRNQIAHEGESFLLTARRAKEAIELYGEFFKGLNYI